MGGPPGPTPGGPPGAADDGPPKTIMIPGSEGVVSFSQKFNVGTPAAMDQSRPHAAAPVVDAGDGPGLVFWSICLLSGLAVGVLAYLAVRMFA